MGRDSERSDSDSSKVANERYKGSDDQFPCGIGGGTGESFEIVPCQLAYIHFSFCFTKTAVYKNSTMYLPLTYARARPVIMPTFP